MVSHRCFLRWREVAVRVGAGRAAAGQAHRAAAAGCYQVLDAIAGDHHQVILKRPLIGASGRRFERFAPHLLLPCVALKHGGATGGR